LIRKLFLGLNALAALALLISILAPYINPNLTSIPAFFGMAFLPIFLLNLLFVVLWAFWKPVYVMFSGLALVFSLGTFSQHFHYAMRTSEGESETVKLASYNVRLFDLYNWKSNKRTRDSILTYLDSVDADVLCIQEFFKSKDNKYFNTLDTLTELLDVHYVHEEYTSVLHRGMNYFGMATFSKYLIVDQRLLPLSAKEHNLAIWTDLDIHGDTIRVFNLHLASVRISGMEEQIDEHIEDDDREQQLNDAVRLLGMLRDGFQRRADQALIVHEAIASSPHPVIVCGDLNDTPGSFAYQTISRGLEDAFMKFGRGTGSTYIGYFPSFRIDYLLYSPELQVSGFRTDNVQLSDHRPLVGEFKWAAAPETE